MSTKASLCILHLNHIAHRIKNQAWKETILLQTA
jgi:hypothetical protein